MNTSSSILWLSLSVNWQMGHAFDGLWKLAERLGYPLSLIEVAAGPDVREQVNAAPAYVVSMTDYLDGALSDGRKAIEFLNHQLEVGKRLLALAYDQRMNGVLDGFDMNVTSHSLWKADAVWPAAREASDSAKGDEFVLARGRSTSSAWSPALLQDVDEVTVRGPRLIHYGGRAEPLLALPDDIALVDSMDLPVNLGKRLPACAASWSSAVSAPPQVVALAGSFVSDPILPRNITLATNLLRWLSGKTMWNFDLDELAERHVKAIEVMLHEIIVTVLMRKVGSEWWRKAVPGNIVKKAEGRWRRRGKRHTPDVRLDLADLPEIVEANWEHFSYLFDPASRGAVEAMSWKERLNDIRNARFHPTRGKLEPATKEEVRFLEDLRLQIWSILRSIRDDQDRRLLGLGQA